LQLNFKIYSGQSHSEFGGRTARIIHYSTELNKIYEIKVVDGELILQIDEDQLKLTAMEKNKFSFQNAMTLLFEGTNPINGFSLDVSVDVRGVKFIKIK
jgi:hypothetical protein